MDDLVAWLLPEINMDLQSARALPNALGGLRSRFSPAKLVTDYEAKLWIVHHYQSWLETLHDTPDGWTAEGCTAYRMAMEWTVRRLAEAYADRPGYRSEWALSDTP